MPVSIEVEQMVLNKQYSLPEKIIAVSGIAIRNTPIPFAKPMIQRSPLSDLYISLSSLSRDI